MTTILMVLIFTLVGVIPAWPYSKHWGNLPGAAVGVSVWVLLVLLMTGRV